MISVYFGKDKSAILDVDSYFNNVYYDDWFDDDIVKQMVQDIDDSIVKSPNCIESKVLGQIAPERLSGGVKTCIMLLKLPKEEFLVDLMVCGQNCAKWISYVAGIKDIRVTMSSCDLDFTGLDLRGICENDNTQIRGSYDWMEKMLDMSGEMSNER